MQRCNSPQLQPGYCLRWLPLFPPAAVPAQRQSESRSIRPLGFNWKIGVGLLTSVVAREVIVGTLGTLYGRDPQTQSAPLQAALQHDLTFSGAMALLVFFAFAMQCTSTLAVVRRETNSWMWPVIQFLYMTGLASSERSLSITRCLRSIKFGETARATGTETVPRLGQRICFSGHNCTVK